MISESCPHAIFQFATSRFYGYIVSNNHHITDKRNCNQQIWFDLCGKADKFECLVLTPAAHNVGERAERVFVQWCRVFWLMLEHHYKQSNHKSQHSIHKDKELRVLEELSRGGFCLPVFMRHDALLENTPCEVRDLKSQETNEKDDGSFDEGLFFHLFLCTSGLPSLFCCTAGILFMAKHTKNRKIGQTTRTCIEN